jgi:hypothetical protein
MNEPTTAQRLAWQAAQATNEENKAREKLQALSRRTELLKRAEKFLFDSPHWILDAEMAQLLGDIRKELGE